MAEWGIQKGITKKIINARVETVKDKPLFKDIFRNHRCLIPASGYYELKHEGSRNIPYYFMSESEPLISFAGLVRPSVMGGEVVILTTEASYRHSKIRECMPVIIEYSDEQKFLSDGIITITREPLLIHEVSPRVKQVNVDDPVLLIQVKFHSLQKTFSDPL